jgi:hypothetical protein
MAFGIILLPAFFIIERAFIFPSQINQSNGPSLNSSSETNSAPLLAPETVSSEGKELDVDLYSDRKFRLKSMGLRVVILSVIAVCACLLHDKALSLLDFLGAFSTAICSIILPISFYLKHMWHDASFGVMERTVAIILCVVCSLGSAYCTYINLIAILSPVKGPAYPLCPASKQHIFYTTNLTCYRP